jgi:hypothetical protein
MAKAQVTKAADTDKKIVLVTFKKNWTRYSPGDIAGFEESVSKKLVEQLKVAENYEAPETEEAPKE